MSTTKQTKGAHQKRLERERDMITTDNYTVTTPTRDYHTSGIGWRQLLQQLKTWGYNAPLSVCRDLWNGKRVVEFGGVKIEDMFYTFNR